MKRVLIANIFGIGDVLFSTPLVGSLKKGIPGLKIDFMCNARSRDIVELIPEVDDIIVYEKDDYARLWNSSKKRFLTKVRDSFRGIRKKKYDAVFDLTLSREFGFLWTLAGIKRRIGLDFRSRGIFLTDKIKFRSFREKHVAEHYLDLLDLIGISPQIGHMRIVPRREDRDKAVSLLKERNEEYSPVVALVPGGGASWGEQAPRKRWDPIGFSRAGDMLASKGYDIVVMGDGTEKELCAEVASKMDKYPLVVINDLTLKEYAAFLAECDAVICNDGGPLHIACAVGTATVSIFGPVDEKVYGPYPRSPRNVVITAREVLCRPCYNSFKLPDCKSGGSCLLDIAPEQVADACLELLSES